MPLSSDPEARERQLAAIRPYSWQPGQSANPGGKPKGAVSLTPAIREIEDLPYAEIERLAEDPSTPMRLRTAAVLWLKAQDMVRGYGDKARDQLLERLDGPVPKTLIYNEQRAEFADVQRTLLDKVERLLSQPVDDTQTAGDDTQA